MSDTLIKNYRKMERLFVMRSLGIKISALSRYSGLSQTGVIKTINRWARIRSIVLELPDIKRYLEKQKPKFFSIGQKCVIKMKWRSFRKYEVVVLIGTDGTDFLCRNDAGQFEWIRESLLYETSRV